MLQVTNLSKHFGTTKAVDQVSFSVKPGEIFSLIGPNGSGKTTIIKLIAGLLRPTSGTVTVNRFNVTQNPIKTKSLIGYIPDDPAVWPAITGEEFLYFTGSLFHLTPATIAQRLPRLLSLFHLRGIETHYFEDYSRGNQQKFTILAALLHQPRLLLIDEPIVGLDPTSAAVAQREFTRFAKSGGSILLATHTLPVAQSISHRIGVLKTGRLVTAGPLSHLRSQAKLKKSADLEDIYRALT
jgi:ABC-2 type transport system ATP-binding protein